MSVLKEKMKTKEEFRKWALSRRTRMEPHKSSAAAKALAGACAARLEELGKDWLAGYIPLPGELSTMLIMRHWLAGGGRAAVPTWNRAMRRYSFSRWEPGMKMQSGLLNIPQPAKPEWLPFSQLDLVLVPGLVFDRRGGRLGFGAGHYDGLLAQCRPGTLFWGIAFDWQIVDMVPQTGRDVKMQALLTPDGLLPVM